MIYIPGSWHLALSAAMIILALAAFIAAGTARGRSRRRIIKPFAVVAGIPDWRDAQQQRSYDSIQEKRWRWRVAANETRRASRRACERETVAVFRQMRVAHRARLGI